MKKLFLFLILFLFSAQSFAGSCPDGSDPVKSISADGTYFVFKCGSNSNNSTSTSTSTSNNSSNNKNVITQITPAYHSGWKQQLRNDMIGMKSHNFQFEKDLKKSRRGSQYQRFELRDGDCGAYKDWDDCANDRQRVEFTADPMMASGKHCIAFSIMLDNSFVVTDPSPTALGQIQQSGGPTGFAGGFKSNPGVLMFHAENGYYDFDWLYLHGSRTDIKQLDLKFRLLPLEEMKGKWNDISFCLDFAKNNMSLWVNGEKKFNINQPPTGLHLPKSIIFKYGIYQSFISWYKLEHNKNKMPTQIVYYDEIRRGSSIEEVDFNINPNLKAID